MVELMVVLGIIGMITSLAYPTYVDTKINAAQLDAKNVLSNIYPLQQVFYDENQRYVAFDYGSFAFDENVIWVNRQDISSNIGFEVTEPEKLRYYYSTDTSLSDIYNLEPHSS